MYASGLMLVYYFLVQIPSLNFNIIILRMDILNFDNRLEGRIHQTLSTRM